MIEPKIFSVRQINRYIKNLMDNDFILNSLWVQGEISNFKAHTSGHFYFTLKDASASITCIMFKGSADLLPFVPENGLSVIICGYVSVYEKNGQYQLYAELMQPVGVGALNLAYEQLRKKLQEEGLFDEDYKREICPSPKCVAVITSPTGAAVRDIIQIIKRRNPYVKIVVVPVLVQGDKAVPSIVAALKLVNQWREADTIILGRGGGSIEDLWAFNEEKVARAVFASEIPVISAVGHETDVTIVDYVADLRASTPSAAAELAVNQIKDSILRLDELLERMENQILVRLSQSRKNLEKLLSSSVLKRPEKRFLEYELSLDDLLKKLSKEAVNRLDKQKMEFSHVCHRLEAASPLSVLKRGYVFAANEKGAGLSSVKEVEVDDMISIMLLDGKLEARIVQKQEEILWQRKS